MLANLTTNYFDCQTIITSIKTTLIIKHKLKHKILLTYNIINNYLRLYYDT